MSVVVEALEIPEVKIIRTARFEDERGFFSETYNKAAFHAAGITLDFVQDNHAMSAVAGTVRGLHFQSEPFPQNKLVRVVRGRILDVAVDIRRGSPTYGRHVAAALSAAEWNQILVPVGFTHGLCTLEPDTEVVYKVDNGYARECDLGLLWNDPDLGIDWPVDVGAAVVSEKDRQQPRLRDLPAYFHYSGGANSTR